MSELVNGDMVYVSDWSIEKAIEEGSQYEFLVVHGGRFVAVSPSGCISVWSYAVKVPKPKYIPFTLETLPKQAITLRQTGFVMESLVVTREINGLWFASAYHSFESVMGKYEMSLDGGETWQAAGMEAE